MKLTFKNTDIIVIIGANPFDDIKAVANVVIEFISHKNVTKFSADLSDVNAEVEIDESFDVENHITFPNEEEVESNGQQKEIYTIKTTGEGKLDTNDNDKLHAEWLAAFGDHLESNTIDNWMKKADVSETALEQIKRTI